MSRNPMGKSYLIGAENGELCSVFVGVDDLIVVLCFDMIYRMMKRISN